VSPRERPAHRGMGGVAAWSARASVRGGAALQAGRVGGRGMAGATDPWTGAPADWNPEGRYWSEGRDEGPRGYFLGRRPKDHPDGPLAREAWEMPVYLGVGASVLLGVAGYLSSPPSGKDQARSVARAGLKRDLDAFMKLNPSLSPEERAGIDAIRYEKN